MTAVQAGANREQRRELPSGSRWVGTLGALLVVLVMAYVPVADDEGLATLPLAAVAVVVSSGLILLARGRPPLLVLVIAVAVYVVSIALQGSPWLYLGAVLVSLSGVARRTDRRTTLWVMVVVALVVVIAALDEPPARWVPLETMLQLMALVGCAAGFGDASRSRSEYIEAITERARQAEDTKEAEARRRVAEERLRIARDLHDALAHQIAVINLSSSVASQAMRTRPDDAEESLATIRQAARAVLAEMAGLLSVLRTDDEEQDASPGNTLTSPVPGLAQLDDLIAEFTRGGLRVDRHIEGVVRAIPEPTDIIAYRLIQEALTNALKHGSDHVAHLEISYQERNIKISVVNATAPANRSAFADLSTFADRPGRVVSGHGLIGAQERAASVGGTLVSAPGPGRVHRFIATLPTENPGNTMNADSAGTTVSAGQNPHVVDAAS